MFKKARIALFGALVSLPVAGFLSPASAALITASEGDNQQGVVTHSTDIDVTNFAFVGSEDFTLSGIFHIPFGNGTLSPGTQSFGLLEADRSVSDYLTLTIPNSGGPVGNDWQQQFSIAFFSDPFDPGFVFDPNTVFTFEDGTMQGLAILQGGLINGSVFQISVQSDLDVPEPGVLALTGASLLSLLGLIVVRRRAQA